MNTNRMISTTKHLPNTFWGSAAAALAAFALAATPATATLVQDPVSSLNELEYQTDVSTTDLLTGLTATTTGTWKPDGGSNVAALNDGVHGDTSRHDQGAFGAVGATAAYHLGMAPFGYDLTSIQSIAAWGSAGRGNQGYTVEVKLKGASAYTTLATVDCELLLPDLSSQGATKVTLTDNSSSHILATGVEYIKFTVNSVNSYDNLTIMREIDVIGVPTPGTDNIAPTIAPPPEPA
ncbi:MAG: hypothetical protein NTW21_00505 [Verrucomicrobia bacterium]|nr:hypothetical protein [Verrucomicrobiota bacterium]